MEASWISASVAVLNMIGTVAVALWVWLDGRNRVTTDRVAAVEARQHEADARLDVVDARLGLSPAHEDLGRVYGRLEAINGQLKELSGEVHGLAKQVGMINQHLLDRSG